MRHTAAADLHHVRQHWADLRDMLDSPTTVGGIGHGLRAHLASIDDDYEAAAERAERTAIAPGERPAPLRVAVLDVVVDVEGALLAWADHMAAWEPDELPTAERWQSGEARRHGAPWACTYLAGALTWLPKPQMEQIATVAQKAAHAVDKTLGLDRHTAPIPHTCPCGGPMILSAGGRDLPEAECTMCGLLWRGPDLVKLVTAAAA